ncbi:MAG TPA: nucleotidyltransferase [Micromonosporaceae bacterium]|nr:nucleotidyltransferase [Micromonosporaceae bacterium]
MELDRDFSEFIASCAAHSVRFLIVGGYAVAAHGHPRFTKDLDVWVWLDEQNADRLIAALEDFGFGSLGLAPADFLEEGVVVQLGYPPKRIDILTQIDGVQFDTCWERRVDVEIGGQRVPFISADDLVTNKKASGRPQDIADVAVIEEQSDRV